MLESIAGLIGRTFQTIAGSLADPGSRTYWAYLLVSLAIAVGIASWGALRARDAQEFRIGSELRNIFSARIWLHRSAITDYLCFAINAAAAPILRVGSLAAGFVAGTGLYGLLLFVNDGEALSLAASGVNLVAYTLFSLLLLDFGKYVGHGLMHRIPILWEFHKIHHSAQVLTPMTVYRIHPMDHVFASFVSGLFIGTAGAIGRFVFGLEVDPIGIFGLNVGIFVFYVVGANLRHSHVWLPYPQWLSRLLISPAQHQIHHSSLPIHHDRNFGSLFAVWDWLFGTLYVPEEREDLTFGLVDEEDREYQSIRALYLLPLVKAGRKVMELAPVRAGRTAGSQNRRDAAQDAEVA